MRIKDVAKQAGVSTSSVSRVLNNSKYISEETKTKVLQAIEDLNYTPSHIARSLKRQKTNLLGVIVPNLSSPYFASLIHPIEETASKHGYHLFISTIMENEDKERSYLKQFLEMKVDGLLILHETDQSAVIDFIKSMPLPIVHVGIKSPAPGLPSVYMDNTAAACTATTHLIAQGHRKIAYIGGNPQRFRSGHDRLAGFKQAFTQHHLECCDELMIFTDYQIESGYNAMQHLLDRKDGNITAVLATSDDLALGAMNCIIDNHLNVPNDISIVGYDGSMMNKWVRPQLTSVEQPMEEVGASAVSLLLSQIDEPNYPKGDIIVNHRLVIRDSCKGI